MLRLPMSDFEGIVRSRIVPRNRPARGGDRINASRMTVSATVDRHLRLCEFFASLRETWLRGRFSQRRKELAEAQWRRF